MKYLSIVFLLIVLTACKTYSDDDLNQFDTEIEAYMDENNLDLEKSSSGMYYSIIEPGDERKIQFTNVVSFKYTGELLDGTEFDNQMEEAITYEVSELIGAWKEIMLELGNGGKAFLIAPPSLGYGTHDLEDIPANSVLIFNMEVVDVK
ncbi:MAG: FKBP-type peptidyl-prolyl cis-trans isomerase [Crocinitomicaceae bacterium]|nr:FKBP-type peptidyl-prolyl cis-trans isomerase [Crocinitomicaceae bacterium]